MPALIICCTYFALLILPFSIGLIVGTDKSLKEGYYKYAIITSLILSIFSFAGIGVGILFNIDIKYMGALLILAAGFTTFNKGGKSNAFLFSIDTQNIKYYVFANLAVGLSVMIATLGLGLYYAIPLYFPTAYILLSFILNLIGISCGRKIKTIKVIKILLVISGIILFLVGLTMFILLWI